MKKLGRDPKLGGPLAKPKTAEERTADRERRSQVQKNKRKKRKQARKQRRR